MLTLIVVVLIYWKSNRLLLNGSKIEKKTNKMTPFPLHTSGIETQSSGKGRHNTMPLKQWVDNFNFAQS